MIIGLYDDDKIVQEEEMSPDNPDTEQQTPVEPPVDTADSEPTEEEPIDDDDNDIEIIDDEEMESPEDNSGETPIPPAETSDEAEAMENIDSESKEIDNFADDMEKPAEPVPNNDVYFNGENPYQINNASPIPTTPTTPAPAAVGIDVTMTNFGNDNSPQQNQYNPKEVERLNDLIASENSAIGEYFQASKETNVDVLRRLYSDIGEEERFHVEQLLFAKSQITGERYVPRDPDIKKEYEELLSMGMDEESAMATAVDKVGLISRNFTISPEETVHEMAMLSDNVCMLSEYVYGEIIDEDSTLFVEADGGSANNGILHTIANAIKRLIGFITSFVKKSGKFVAAKARFIKNHGFGNLFKDGFELYFYNIEKGGKEGFAYDEAANYLVRMAYCANWIARDAGMRLDFSPQNDMEFQGYNHENYQPKNLDDSVNGIRNVSMMKTKVMITDQNQNYLKEQLFGVNGTDANNVSSDSAMTNLGLLLKDFSKLITALEKLNNSLAQLQNPQQKATFEKYLSVVTAQAQKFSGYITHDIGVIQKMNQTIIEAAQKDYQATDNQQFQTDQEPTSDENGVVQIDDQGVATVVGEVIDFAKNEVQRDPSIVDSINGDPNVFRNEVNQMLDYLENRYGRESANVAAPGRDVVGSEPQQFNNSDYIEIVDDEEVITEAANQPTFTNEFVKKLFENIDAQLTRGGMTPAQKQAVIARLRPELEVDKLGPILTSVPKLQEGKGVVLDTNNKQGTADHVLACKNTVNTVVKYIDERLNDTTTPQGAVEAYGQIVDKLNEVFSVQFPTTIAANTINDYIDKLNNGLDGIPEQLEIASQQTAIPATQPDVTAIKSKLEIVKTNADDRFTKLANAINGLTTGDIKQVTAIGTLLACIGDRIKGKLSRIGSAVTNAIEKHRNNVQNNEQMKADNQAAEHQRELTSQRNSIDIENKNQTEAREQTAKFENAKQKIGDAFNKIMNVLITPIPDPANPSTNRLRTRGEFERDAANEIANLDAITETISIEIIDDIYQEAIIDNNNPATRLGAVAQDKFRSFVTGKRADKVDENTKTKLNEAVENVWNGIVNNIKQGMENHTISTQDIFNKMKEAAKSVINQYKGNAGNKNSDVDEFIRIIPGGLTAMELNPVRSNPTELADKFDKNKDIENIKGIAIKFGNRIKDILLTDPGQMNTSVNLKGFYTDMLNKLKQLKDKLSGDQLTAERTLMGQESVKIEIIDDIYQEGLLNNIVTGVKKLFPGGQSSRTEIANRQININPIGGVPNNPSINDLAAYVDNSINNINYDDIVTNNSTNKLYELSIELGVILEYIVNKLSNAINVIPN